MKKVTLLTAFGILLFCAGINAQQTNTDSLKLVSQISDNQLKLGKMQNEVEQKTKNKQDANAQSQKSANENSDAASKLNNDPNNRKLARQADNKAENAKSDARSARKETRRLNSLNKDIASLKNTINDQQVQLDKLTGNITPLLN